MNTKLFIFLCSCFIIVQSSFGSSINKCKDAISEQDLNICMDKELKLQDKKLNFAYKNAMGKIEDFRKVELRKIQRLWIKYTDAKCAFFYHKQSGSGGLTESIQCKLEETVKRTTELENIY